MTSLTPSLRERAMSALGGSQQPTPTTQLWLADTGPCARTRLSHTNADSRFGIKGQLVHEWAEGIQDAFTAGGTSGACTGLYCQDNPLGNPCPCPVWRRGDSNFWLAPQPHGQVPGCAVPELRSTSPCAVAAASFARPSVRPHRTERMPSWGDCDSRPSQSARAASPSRCRRRSSPHAACSGRGEIDQAASRWSVARRKQRTKSPV
jgi:hypothetical protein